MCVVVDTCALHKVFRQDDGPFLPVQEWLRHGKGKLVLGGSTYERELKAAAKYIHIIAELKRAGKVVVVDRGVVDATEKCIRQLEPNKDFDDPHLVAIVNVSRCRIVCTDDARADRFLRQARFYKNCKRPAIYRRRSHAHLLCNKNIVGACVNCKR